MKFFSYFTLLCFIFISVSLCIYFSLLYENEKVDYLKDVTSQLNVIFETLDKNNDGYLDIDEFSSFKKNYRIFMHKQEEDVSFEIQEFPSLPTKLGEQIIYIAAEFKPLDLNSLKKNIFDVPKNELGSLQGLLAWQTPHKTGHPFGAKSFSVFLPENEYFKVGFPWWIVEPKLDKYSRPLSSERHFPSVVEEKYHPLFALLSLFHPQPFLWTRFAPQGTAAVIRAINKDFYDIIFRMHAEFQLNKPPLHPFWFTPSQFSGQVIINKDATIVKYFHMTVPNRKLNVDMEWLNGPSEDSMEVDIGYIPQMSLISSLISADPPDKLGEDQNVSSIQWDKEISFEEALDALELHFFPFKEDYKKQDPQSQVSKLASTCLEYYEFPVESIVFFPNGSVIHRINANTLLALVNDEEQVFSLSMQDPIEKRYQDFLELGLRKSKTTLIAPEKEL